MNCKNCETQLEPHDRFCKFCGAKIVTTALTYGYLANEVSERFFNIENNLIWRTIKDMFRRPGEVIHGYINGIRKRHLNPASFLALAITTSGLFLFLMQKFFQENMDASWMGQEDNPMLQDMGWFDFMYEYQSIMYLAFIPIYALLAKFTFFNYKGRNKYLHHLIVTTYTQAHLSVVYFIPGLIAMALDINFFKYTYFFTFPLMIVFSAYVYKRFYQLTLGKIVGKTLLFAAITLVLYIGFSIAFVAILFITGTIDFEEMMEAEKAKRAVSYIASSAMNWTS
ncbi:MAG: DUF3667 domain-containing protein [Marinirhabdus sp.]|nr:DUF3667 domain-containing protein [Marinirhabdus sp.]